MPQPDDFEPRKKGAGKDLSVTVPDIFASTGKEYDVPSESTAMKLASVGSLQFPGTWLRLESHQENQDSLTYRRKDSISALVTIGPLPLDERGELLIKNLCKDEARTLQGFELAGLRAALSNTRRPDKYEITAGSTELLCEKNVLVILGFFPREAMKEALIIFPDGKTYGQLSFKSIQVEFAIYFNHLRQALKTVDWI